MIAYLKARLLEDTTWIGFGLALAAAAALPQPFNWVVGGCGCVAAVLKSGGAKA